MLTVDKTINQLSVSGNRAYLATNFGIVVINAERHHHRHLQSGDKVAAVTLGGGDIYAATTEGIIKGSQKDNLTDKACWTKVADKAFKWIFWRGGHRGINNGELCQHKRKGRQDGLRDEGVAHQRLPKRRGCIVCTGAKTSLTSTTLPPTTLVRTTFTGLALRRTDRHLLGPGIDDLLCNMKMGTHKRHRRHCDTHKQRHSHRRTEVQLLRIHALHEPETIYRRRTVVARA